MRAEEYLSKVTADIADPGRALDAYRELKCHLEEAKAEAVAQGVEPATAELVAMARMGAPEVLSLSLAVAHHRHIPWRHYLAVLPLACTVFGVVSWGAGWFDTVGQWWLALLVFCIVPSGATVRKALRLLQVDLQAKRDWLLAQPLRPAAISGAAAGIAAGVILSGLLGMHPSAAALFALPTLTGIVMVLMLRRVHTGPAILTACFAALAFPAGSLPVLVHGWEALTIWLAFSAIFSVQALAMGWLAQTLERKGWLPRT